MRDHTETLVNFRKARKEEKDRNTRNRLEQLAQIMSIPKVENTSTVQKLFRRFSISTKANAETYCLYCRTSFGMFTKKSACQLCEKTFCLECIKKLTSRDITGILNENEGILFKF